MNKICHLKGNIRGEGNPQEGKNLVEGEGIKKSKVNDFFMF